MSELGPVLVTGAQGQLGQELVDALRGQGIVVIPWSRQDVDLQDGRAVREALQALELSLIFHCGAMTQVDLCESEQKRAYLVNSMGTYAICQGARAINAKVIYISTDYVFDGRDPDGYHEFSQPSPLSVYGRSKLLGEQHVARSLDNLIVRVSWLFGPRGHNFVKAISKRAGRGLPLKIVNDQRGIPTYAPDLADKLIEIARAKVSGVLHMTSGDEACTWYDFGREILSLGAYEVPVEACSTQDYGLAAPRPACSVLRSFLLETYGLTKARGWREALAENMALFQG